MRGIIASCDFCGDEKSLEIKSTNIDPFRLRQYLLYWDKIDYPTNNIVYIALTPEEEYLEKIGVLQRTHVDFYSNTGIMINAEIFVIVSYSRWRRIVRIKKRFGLLDRIDLDCIYLKIRV